MSLTFSSIKKEKKKKGKRKVQRIIKVENQNL